MRKSIAAAVSPPPPPSPAAARSTPRTAGPTVSRNYQVGNFQQIEVAGPYDVEVRTGANPSVSAKGSEKLLERTVVEVKGDKLRDPPRRTATAGSTSAGRPTARRTSRSPFRS